MSRPRPLTAIAALLGAFWGIAGARFLFVGEWMSLIPWGVTGAIIGGFAASRKDALTAGAAYGSVLPVAFMLAGYDGAWTPAKLGPLLVFCIVLAAIGVGCGCALALTGRFLAGAGKKKKPA